MKSGDLLVISPVKAFTCAHYGTTGVPREEARDRIRAQVDQVVENWRR